MNEKDISPFLLRLRRSFAGLRCHLGHAQAQWADHLDKDASDISRMERGKAPIHAAHLFVIAEKSGFPVTDFFRFDPDQNCFPEAGDDTEKTQLKQDLSTAQRQQAHLSELVERLKKDVDHLRGGGRKVNPV